MAASFNSLPVKRIVDMVHEQDAAFHELGLEQGRLLEPERSDEEDDAEDRETDVVQGRWTAWYGMGICALAQVDRRLRQLALPHLYERVSIQQINNDHFRFEVLGEALGQHVRHVGLGTSIPSSALVPVACALRKLPNLSSMELGDQELEKAYPPAGAVQHPDAILFARALRQTLHRIASLDVQTPRPDVFAKMVGDLDSSRLRSLTICVLSNLFRTFNEDLLRAMHSLVALEELKLEHVWPSSALVLEEHLRIPSLRTLTLHTTSSYERNLLPAHSITPTLTSLTVVAFGAVLDSDPAVTLPTPPLPTLQSLAVQQAPAYLPAFHETRPPAVTHFSLSLHGLVTAFPLDVQCLPSPGAPQSLHAIAISYSSGSDFRPPRALLAACAARDVRLVIHRTPWSVPEFLCWPERPMARTSPAATRTVARAIRESLDWARARMDWLLEVEGGVGLHELAQATVRLRERHLIDLS